MQAWMACACWRPADAACVEHPLVPGTLPVAAADGCLIGHALTAGIVIRTKSPVDSPKQQGLNTHQAPAQQQDGHVSHAQAPQKQQQPTAQHPAAQQHSPQQQTPKQLVGPKLQRQHLKARQRRVAASAARRALLLERLAQARVQARSRIVRLPLRLSIAGRAKSRRYLTVPVDMEGEQCSALACLCFLSRALRSCVESPRRLEPSVTHLKCSTSC